MVRQRVGLLQPHERRRGRARQAEVGAPPAFVVHGRREAEAALAAAAALNRAVLLVSAEGAACYGGVAWFRGLVEGAAAARPDAVFEALLDCGDNPALVVQALREGVRLIAFAGRPALFRRLEALAAREGAQLVSRRPKALDLGREAVPAEAARRWLEKASAKARQKGRQGPIASPGPTC